MRYPRNMLSDHSTRSGLPCARSSGGPWPKASSSLWSDSRASTVCCSPESSMAPLPTTSANNKKYTWFVREQISSLLDHRSKARRLPNCISSLALFLALGLAIPTQALIIRLRSPAFRHPEIRPWRFGLVPTIGCRKLHVDKPSRKMLLC